MGSGSRQGVWVRGAGRVYGFGGPAGCMGSGGRQGVWVREPTGCMGSGAGRVYGFGRPAGCMGSGGRQGVLVRGVGIQVGTGHSILMTGVLLRTSQSMRDCR